MGRVFGYCRVSTNTQDAELQRKQITEHLNSRKMELTEFYSDVCSAKLKMIERPASKELMVALRKGDTVVITRLDRAFRRTLECLQVLEDWCAKGITLHVIQFSGMSLDLNSPMGKLMVQLLAAISEMERNTISERTKEALRTMKVKTKTTIGYKLVKITDRTRPRGYRTVEAPNHQERETCALLLRKRLEGLSLSELTLWALRNKIPNRATGQWTIAQINLWLKAAVKFQQEELNSDEPVGDAYKEEVRNNRNHIV